MSSKSGKSGRPIDKLIAGTPVLLDGGLATELEAQGHDISGVLWSAMLLHTDPQAIVDAHRAYLNAGAEIIISASYQASRAGFHQLGIDADDADDLIASSVSLARRARDEYCEQNRGITRPRLVAASVGPYGAVLMDGSEYTGDYGVSQAVLRNFHEQRLQILDQSGADVLACETIPSLQEAEVLADLLSNVHTPAWVSFTCRDETAIADGTAIEEAVAMFADHPGVFAVGINCTAPQHVQQLIERFVAAAPNKSILAYPNSGERYEASDNSWSGTVTETDFASVSLQWLDAGAILVGGCCRVGPTHIAAMADSWSAPTQ
jgi:homocysteine S-methyltransferase